MMGNLEFYEIRKLEDCIWADSVESVEHDGQSYILLPTRFNEKVAEVTVDGWMFKKEKMAAKEIWYGPNKNAISLPAKVEVSLKDGQIFTTILES